MATNFTISQSKMHKAFARLNMILTEFFEKWYSFSFALAIYNTLWWIANYSGWVKLHFYAQRKITRWADKYIMDSYSLKINHFPPHHHTHIHHTMSIIQFMTTIYGCFGGRELKICPN